MSTWRIIYAAQWNFPFRSNCKEELDTRIKLAFFYIPQSVSASGRVFLGKILGFDLEGVWLEVEIIHAIITALNNGILFWLITLYLNYTEGYLCLQDEQNKIKNGLDIENLQIY